MVRPAIRAFFSAGYRWSYQKYDWMNRVAGRVKEGKSGAEARGGSVTTYDEQKLALPYRQSYSFDAFGHLTESSNLHWGRTAWYGQSFNQTYAYSNNRVQRTGWTYDEDGRNTQSTSDTESTSKTFNAAGQLVRVVGSDMDRRTFYDGGGAEVKRQTDTLNDETSVWEAQPTKYYIRSSVLKGQVVSEVWANGKKHRTYVRGIGNQTAVQSAYASETAQINELVLFEFSDASGMSYRTTDKLGAAVATGDGGEGSPIETDPLGGSVGMYTPFIELTLPYEPEYSELRPFDVPNTPTPNFTSLYSHFGSRVADLPGFGTNWGSFSELGMAQYEERVRNSWYGIGFNTNEQLGRRPDERLRGFSYLRADGSEHGGTLTAQEALEKADNNPNNVFANWDEGTPWGLDSQGQQDTVPITVRYMNKKYVKDFLKVHDEAKKRLKKDECAKLFGKSVEDLVKMLENTEYRVLTFPSGGPKYDPYTGVINVVGAQTNSPTSVFINDKGPFFTNQMFVQGKSGLQTLDLGTGLRGAQFGALLLLHELGHQTGIFGPDAGNQELNTGYTRRVQKACF